MQEEVGVEVGGCRLSRRRLSVRRVASRGRRILPVVVVVVVVGVRRRAQVRSGAWRVWRKVSRSSVVYISDLLTFFFVFVL